MKEKWLYVVLGFMSGVILVLVLGKIPAQPVLATSEPANLNSGSANGMIALTTNTSKLNETILWVLDTNKKKLLTYEYTGTRSIKFRSFRDIQHDLTIVDGSAGTVEPQNANWSPLEIKKWFEELDKLRKK